MNDYINLISATIGGAIALAGKYVTSFFSNRSNNEINIRDTLLRRIDQLEARQGQTESRMADTEAKMHRWIMRYWALYRWTIVKYSIGEFDSMPPNFHEMAEKDIESELEQNDNNE